MDEIKHVLHNMDYRHT